MVKKKNPICVIICMCECPGIVEVSKSAKLTCILCLLVMRSAVKMCKVMSQPCKAQFHLVVMAKTKKFNKAYTVLFGAIKTCPE